MMCDDYHCDYGAFFAIQKEPREEQSKYCMANGLGIGRLEDGRLPDPAAHQRRQLRTDCIFDSRTLSQALTPMRPHTHSGNKAATVVVFQHKYIILSAAGCLFVMLRISAAIFSSPLLAFSPLFPIFPAFPGPTVPSSISRHCVRIKRNG